MPEAPQLTSLRSISVIAATPTLATPLKLNAKLAHNVQKPARIVDIKDMPIVARAPGANKIAHFLALLARRSEAATAITATTADISTRKGNTEL
jgi:hypothetical protein